jgi:TolB-like protein
VVAWVLIQVTATVFPYLDVARDDHIWAERYDRRLKGVFAVLAIVDRIAGALAMRTPPRPSPALPTARQIT